MASIYFALLGIGGCCLGEGGGEFPAALAALALKKAMKTLEPQDAARHSGFGGCLMMLVKLEQ